MNKYKRTLVACYLGLITQAIAANFAPLLFLIFHNYYNIPLGICKIIWEKIQNFPANIYREFIFLLEKPAPLR